MVAGWECGAGTGRWSWAAGKGGGGGTRRRGGAGTGSGEGAAGALAHGPEAPSPRDGSGFYRPRSSTADFTDHLLSRSRTRPQYGREAARCPCRVRDRRGIRDVQSPATVAHGSTGEQTQRNPVVFRRVLRLRTRWRRQHRRAERGCSHVAVAGPPARGRSRAATADCGPLGKYRSTAFPATSVRQPHRPHRVLAPVPGRALLRRHERSAGHLPRLLQQAPAPLARHGAPADFARMQAMAA